MGIAIGLIAMLLGGLGFLRTQTLADFLKRRLEKKSGPVSVESMRKYTKIARIISVIFLVSGIFILLTNIMMSL